MSHEELREKIAVARELLVSAERNLEVVVRGLKVTEGGANVMAGTELLEAFRRVKEARQVVSGLLAVRASAPDEDGSAA